MKQLNAALATAAASQYRNLCWHCHTNAVESGDKEAAKAELTAATKTIEMAASKGVYHKNNVARKISRLSKAVNGMA